MHHQSFKELVAACLVKDPKKRPSSEKLLKHHFFKHGRSVDYLSRTILEGISPLGDRFRTIKAKEADFLVQNKALYGDKEQLSQQEHIRGISAWKFNLEDLKNQAALIQHYDILNIEESSVNGKLRDGHDEDGFPAENPSPVIVDPEEAAPHFQDVLDGNNSMEDSLAAFPIKPIQALKYSRAFYSLSVVHLYKIMLLLKRSTMLLAEDAPEGAVIQRRGCFKVTSADLSPKDISTAPSNGPSNCGFGGSVSPSSPSIAAASFLPSLQCILQQNRMQKVCNLPS